MCFFAWGEITRKLFIVLNDGNHKLRGSVSKCGYSSTVMLQIRLKIRDFFEGVQTGPVCAGNYVYT